MVQLVARLIMMSHFIFKNAQNALECQSVRFSQIGYLLLKVLKDYFLHGKGSCGNGAWANQSRNESECVTANSTNVVTHTSTDVICRKVSIE